MAVEQYILEQLDAIKNTLRYTDERLQIVESRLMSIETSTHNDDMLAEIASLRSALAALQSTPTETAVEEEVQAELETVVEEAVEEGKVTEEEGELLADPSLADIPTEEIAPTRSHPLFRRVFDNA